MIRIPTLLETRDYRSTTVPSYVCTRDDIHVVAGERTEDIPFQCGSSQCEKRHSVEEIVITAFRFHYRFKYPETCWLWVLFDRAQRIHGFVKGGILCYISYILEADNGFSLSVRRGNNVRSSRINNDHWVVLCYGTVPGTWYTTVGTGTGTLFWIPGSWH